MVGSGDVVIQGRSSVPRSQSPHSPSATPFVHQAFEVESDGEPSAGYGGDRSLSGCATPGRSGLDEAPPEAFQEKISPRAE